MGNLRGQSDLRGQSESLLSCSIIICDLIQNTSPGAVQSLGLHRMYSARVPFPGGMKTQGQDTLFGREGTYSHHSLDTLACQTSRLVNTITPTLINTQTPKHSNTPKLSNTHKSSDRSFEISRFTLLVCMTQTTSKISNGLESDFSQVSLVDLRLTKIILFIVY